MKEIYFACAITGGRDHAHVYPKIVGYIKDAGMHVLSEIFASTSVKSSQGLGAQHGMTPAEIWEWDMGWIRAADAIIAEVTQPSLGVGYEIATAYTLGKPVLALYHPLPERKLSSMIAGSPNVTVFEYNNVAETEAAIKEFLAGL
ncbi:MAG TPA: nucleoside 2-deoxyribosyltransferase [Candidatus Saccharimonadales bacterium]